MTMRTWALVLIAAACFAPRSAQAQGFNAELHRPVTSTSGYFSQDKASVLGAGQWNGGLTLDYAHNPLVIRDPASGDVVESVVANRLVTHLGFSVGLLDFLELRARLPLVVYQNGSRADLSSAGKLSTTVVGDLDFAAKAGVLGRPGSPGFHLAVLAALTVPTGNRDSFSGDGLVSFRPRLVVGFETARSSLALNAGYDMRREADLPAVNFTVDDQLAGGLGLAQALIPASLWLMGEVYFHRRVSGSPGIRDTPAEGVVGARYAPNGGPFMLQAGVGVGLTSGAGSPAARGLLSLAYATDLAPPLPPPPPPPPPPPVAVAPAPPPPPADGDRDRDGIVDRLDRCPTEPEDVDQFEDEDGCPDSDNDKDGVVDASDKCPNDPEDKDQFEDENGCPDPDNDGDGIADAADRCPGEAEIFNGVTDDDGCPDAGAPLAQVTDQKIEIRQQVNFASGKARIEKSSFLLLATVAKLLALHPLITRVRVEGHTDDRGNAQKNLKLSQQRAEAVRDHLVQVNGVEAARLDATGFGSTQPLVPNLTQKARAQNRRVEFIIVEKNGAPSGP